MKKIKFGLLLMILTTSINAMNVMAEESGLTKGFVGKASMADKFEVETSKLALERSADPEVKGFANAIITDHTDSSNQLKEAVTREKLSNYLSTTLDKVHQGKLDELKRLNGKSFNEKYIEMQTEGHTKAIEMFQEYAAVGDNQTIRKFAMKTLPTLKKHKAHVEGLNGSNS